MATMDNPVSADATYMRMLALEHAVKLRLAGRAAEGMAGIIEDAETMHQFLNGEPGHLPCPLTGIEMGVERDDFRGETDIYLPDHIVHRVRQNRDGLTVTVLHGGAAY